MRAVAEEAFGGFHDGFRQGRMRMDGKFQVLGDSAHFNGHDPFSDHVPGANSDNTHSQDTLGFRVNDEFGQVRLSGQGSARGLMRPRGI